MRKRKYILDSTSLQFLQHRPVWTDRLLRVSAGFGVSILIAFVYIFIFNHLFGSPKEKILNRQLDELKFNYVMLDRKMDKTQEVLADLRSTDNSTFRPILDLSSIPESMSEGGSGGTDKYSDLTGFDNSDMLIDTRSKFEDIKTQTNIQFNSFVELSKKATDWKNMWDCLPYFRPVDVIHRVGDGFHYRDKHPVLGIGKWHFGQDFPCPIGTKVYATGAGTVLLAASEGDGYGKKIIIDHGYGYRTLYGHLSRFNVKSGQKVKRGDLIGFSGTTGISSGPHLHYQIDLYGEHVNPLGYFTDDLTEEEYFKIVGLLHDSIEKAAN
jgi:murein DD-endopeptidase MepM/ murein hydrolase activator NlpD